MQLKRNSDYLLRIVFFLAKNRINNSEKLYFSAKEICRMCCLPYAITLGILTQLIERKLVCMTEDDTVHKYRAEIQLLDSTLYDILIITERTMDVFDLFDPKNKQYQHIVRLFSTIEKECEGAFKKTIRQITDR